MPKRIVVVDESITDELIHPIGDYLHGKSIAFYKFFFSIWPFDKAFENCKALAMNQIEKIIRTTK